MFTKGQIVLITETLQVGVILELPAPQPLGAPYQVRNLATLQQVGVTEAGLSAV